MNCRDLDQSLALELQIDTILLDIKCVCMSQWHRVSGPLGFGLFNDIGRNAVL